MKTVSGIVIVLAVTSLCACQQPTKNVENALHSEHDHSVSVNASYEVLMDTPYYKNGPQQARKPDGTFKKGTVLTVMHDAGSYVHVKSKNGVTAYVAKSAIKMH